MIETSASSKGISKPERPEVPGTWLASLGDAASTKPEELGRGGHEFLHEAPIGAGRMLRLLGGHGHSLPAVAEDATCVVIFDGVLYNRSELSNGFTDSSATTTNDAHLVLQAYRRWGEDLLHKVKGLFALCIWDSRSQTLLCARDPLGTYSLFYADAGCELLLSTSIDALVRHPRVSSAVNRAALAELVMGRTYGVEETVFSAVRRVPPGHAMRVHGGNWQIYRYWSPFRRGAPVEWIAEDEVEERFEVLLDQVIGRFLDWGPAGIFLSGGLDSVAVAAVAADNSRRRGLPEPWALSLVFPSPDTTEEVIQKGIAERLGLPQILAPWDSAVGPDGLLLASVAAGRSWPAPLINTWWPAYQHLALEGKRQGCRVILTGSGGDEWLGTNKLHAADMIRGLDLLGLYLMYRSTRHSFAISRRAVLRELLWTYGARPWLHMAAVRGLQSVAPGVLRERRQRSHSTPAWVVPDPALRQEILQRAIQRVEQRELRSMPGQDSFYVNNIQNYLDQTAPAIQADENFERARRLEMPMLRTFFDADLVDLLARTSPRKLNKGVSTKGLVRGPLAKRFPDLGFDRQKKLWASTFFASLVLKEGPRVWETIGGTPALADLGIVDAKIVASSMKAAFASNQLEYRYAGQLWHIMNHEAWLQQHL